MARTKSKPPKAQHNLYYHAKDITDNMRQIKYTTTIPQIYDTTIIIGACRVVPRDKVVTLDEGTGFEGSGFDMGQC